MRVFGGALTVFRLVKVGRFVVTLVGEARPFGLEGLGLQLGLFDVSLATVVSPAAAAGAALVKGHLSLVAPGNGCRRTQDVAGRICFWRRGGREHWRATP